MQTVRLTHAIHDEMAARIAIIAEDPDWLRDNPDEADAAKSLDVKLHNPNPYQTKKKAVTLELTEGEAALLKFYLFDRADILRDFAEYDGNYLYALAFRMEKLAWQLNQKKETT